MEVISQTLVLLAGLIAGGLGIIHKVIFTVFSGVGEIALLIFCGVAAWFFEEWREFGMKKWIPMGILLYVAIRLAGGN